MLTWILIAVLYGAVVFAFGWLGGTRAAGRSVEEWGRLSTRHRTG